MKTIVLVNPFRCRVWELHERLEDHITEHTCKAEIQSFSEHGQLIPALGRPVHDDPRYDVEIVYGARRLFVTRHLNKPLQVELRDLTDKEAILAIDIENRQRQEISPFERGRSFDHWLSTGYFQTQGEIAQLLRISQAQVSRLLKLARLPQLVIEAFQDPINIRESWGVHLSNILEQPLYAAGLLQNAREILRTYPRPSPLEIYRRLATAVPKCCALAEQPDGVVRDRHGEPLFKIKHHRDAVTFVLPLTKVSAYDLERIKSAVSRVLQRPLIPASEFRPLCTAQAPMRYRPAELRRANA